VVDENLIQVLLSVYYWKRPRHAVQQHNAIQYFHVVLVRLVIMWSLLYTYSIGILKCKVIEHYSSVCAAREVTD